MLLRILVRVTSAARAVTATTVALVVPLPAVAVAVVPPLRLLLLRHLLPKLLPLSNPPVSNHPSPLLDSHGSSS